MDKDIKELESYSNGYSWMNPCIQQHRYNNTLSDGENYRNLEKHHIEETTFLIEKIRELAQRLLKIKLLAHQAIKK
jgi:hypothetical protein